MPPWWNGRHASLRNLCLVREGSSLSGGTMKKVIIRYNDLALKVTVTEDNTHIEDSYRVKNIFDMWNVLNMIQEECEEELSIHKRALSGMINEWRVHNLLYSLGIQRDRTKSVDLNIGQPWYVKVAYFLLSPLYLHFS